MQIFVPRCGVSISELVQKVSILTLLLLTSIILKFKDSPLCMFGFEVLTRVTTLWWDEITCSPVEINLRFRGTHCFHLQNRRIKQGSNQQVLLLVYSSIEAARAYEVSAAFYQTTWR